MIWLFDSWFWGLSTLLEFQKIMPEYDYIYFWDSLNVPYWDKSLDEILKLTEDWVRFLFESGAKIVIIACNTATACAIRILQQKVFPDKKILWVTIPGVEKIAELKLKKVWVLATPTTVKLRAYKKRVQSLNDKIVVQEIWAPELVPLIEKWEFKDSSFENILKNYLDKFDSDIEAIVLGCTHYSLIKDQIKNISNKQIIDPSYDSAIKFREYLKRHLKIKNSLSLWWKTIFYTTWDITNFLKTWKMFIKNLNLSQIKKAQI